MPTRGRSASRGRAPATCECASTGAGRWACQGASPPGRRRPAGPRAPRRTRTVATCPSARGSLQSPRRRPPRAAEPSRRWGSSPARHARSPDASDRPMSRAPRAAAPQRARAPYRTSGTCPACLAGRLDASGTCIVRPATPLAPAPSAAPSPGRGRRHVRGDAQSSLHPRVARTGASSRSQKLPSPYLRRRPVCGVIAPHPTIVGLVALPCIRTRGAAPGSVRFWDRL